MKLLAKCVIVINGTIFPSGSTIQQATLAQGHFSGKTILREERV